MPRRELAIFIRELGMLIDELGMFCELGVLKRLEIGTLVIGTMYWSASVMYRDVSGMYCRGSSWYG